MIQPGNQIEKIIRHTKKELFLIAPFIKVNTLSRLLNQVGQSITIQIVTRWRVDEIAIGVSDLEVYLLIKDHPNRRLYLRSDLHAKYYRGDQQVLVGSANLTNAALGWSQNPNFELLIESPILDNFEQQLFAGSVLVDDTIYKQAKECVAVMPTFVMTQNNQSVVDIDLNDEVAVSFVSAEAWLPILRHPEKLYMAYLGEFDQFSTGARITSIKDLSALDIPLGLDRQQFEAYVGFQLLQKPIIRQIDRFVAIPQRFGAVRDLLKTLPCTNQEDFDADIAWQTIMRWLLHFLSKRYELSIARHSEIFRRTI